MKKENPRPDYYPVYKDIAELAVEDSPEGKPGKDLPVTDKFNAFDTMTPGSIDSALMFDADSLVGISCESDLSAFQAHILLIKNSFEGHAFLTFNKSPLRILNEGIYSTEFKQDSLIGNFFEQIDYYLTGLRNGWKMILDNEKVFRGYQPDLSLNDLCFEELMYYSLANQLFRFPVSYFANFDIFRFSNSCSKNLAIARKWFNLIMKGESALKDYLYVENINKKYSEIFEDQLRMLDLKQNVLMRYDLKLFFAHDMGIRNEKELEDRMSDYITENRTGKSGNFRNQLNGNNSFLNQNNITTSVLEKKIKLLYRSVSMNCREANDNPGCEIKYPELFRSYYEKEKINREIVFDTPRSIMKYLRLLQILSVMLVYRKIKGLAVYEGYHSYPDASRDEILSETDFSSVSNELDTMVALARINSRSDAKFNYISDEFMIETHRKYLQKQVEFIDQEILKIQEDIRNILKSK